MAALHNVTLFIVNILFSFALFIILLRIVLQFFRANVNNPICQMTAKLTNPVVLPLRGVLPRVSFIDLSSVLVLVIVEILKFFTISLIQGVNPGFFLIFLMSLTDIILQTIDLFFYAILIRVILSWINSNNSLYLNEIVYLITEPLLGRIRRVIPAIAGMDFSPIVAFILLKVCSIVVLSYLPG